MKRIVEFVGRNGQPLSLVHSTIEAIIGEEAGCTIVTAHDTHRVTASHAEAKAEIWPELCDPRDPPHVAADARSDSPD